MTTVVACTQAGSVFMAADSMINVYDRPIVGSVKKIARIAAGDGEALIGMSGAGGLPGTIAAGFKLPDVPGPDDDPHPWAHAVAVAVTQLAMETGLVEDGKLDGSVLLGWRGQLWTIGHAVAVGHPDGRAAIGSGEGPAIGALDVLLNRGVLPAVAVVEAAHVACQRCRFSSPPLQFERLSGS